MATAKPPLLRSALIAGALFGAASAIPILNFLNCFCCALAILGGVLAAYFYIQESPVPVASGDGALLGLLTGVIGAFVSTLLGLPFAFLFRRMFLFDPERMLRELPPDIPPEAHQVIERLLQASIGLVGIIATLLMNLVFFSIFALIGGVIGVALFEKRPGIEPGSP